MTQFNRLLIIVMFLFSPVIMGVDQHNFLSIQTGLSSAKEASFGRLSVADTLAIGNVMINPASIGGITYNQFLLSTYQLSSEFDYRHLSVLFPYNDYTIGVSFGSNVSGGFTKTALNNSVVYDIGSFSSGFDVLHLSLAQKIDRPVFFIDQLHYGFGLSILSQVIGSQRRSPAYGLDVGVITSHSFNSTAINRLELGGSIINALSTGLPAWTYDSDIGQSKAQSAERQLFGGANLTILDYTTVIKSGVYLQGMTLRDVMVGVDYMLTDSFAFRASTTYDLKQEQAFVYHIGTGLMLNRVAGIGAYVYDMSVDYNFTLYSGLRSSDPSHAISVAFYGASADQRPVVLSPSGSKRTMDSRVDFNGTADRNAQLYVYNNDVLIGQVFADNHGKWNAENVPLNAGYNSFTFRSKSKGNDLSKPSHPVVLEYDKTPPNIRTNWRLNGDQMVLDVMSDEPLRRAMFVSGNVTKPFNRVAKNTYSIVVELPDGLQSGSPLPEKMVAYKIVVEDSFGNKAPTQSVSFFMETLFPSDRSVVYNDSLTVLGYLSPNLSNVFVNNKRVSVDKNNAFSSSVDLGFGKQLVTVRIQTPDGQDINYYSRILCLKQFSDIPTSATYRRDIEYLATLGYIDGVTHDMFFPDQPMTRRDVALAVAKLQQLAPKSLSYDPFIDVPKTDDDAGVLSAAVDAGIITAFGDGSFRPDEPMSVADAFNILVNVGIIESDDVVVNDNPIKRVEFALFFKQVPQYDQRVNYLLNWDQGYSLPR